MGGKKRTARTGNLIFSNIRSQGKTIKSIDIKSNCLFEAGIIFNLIYSYDINDIDNWYKILNIYVPPNAKQQLF